MYRHFTIRYLSAICFSVFLFSGCGGPKQLIKKEGSRPTAPDWLNRVPQSKEYLYFVGISSRAASLKEGKEQARADATKQAANYIGVKLESKFQMQASTERESTRVDEKIKAQTAAYIASLETVDEYSMKTTRQAGNLYEEHYDLYLLCRFPKKAEQVERARQKRIAQEKVSIALALYQDAKRDLENQKLAHSLYKLRQAEKELRGVSDFISINNTKLKTNQELKTAVNLTLAELENKSRSLYADIKIAGEREHENCALFVGSFSKEVSKYRLNISEKDNVSRFGLSVNINHRKGGRVFRQQCVYAVYNFEIKDMWANKTIAGDSGEAKGFAPTTDAAAQNAVTEAASIIGKKVGFQIEKYLQLAH